MDQKQLESENKCPLLKTPISGYNMIVKGEASYFFLCLFFLKRFLRLWVAILCLFLFLPLGIVLNFKCFYESIN